MNGMLERIAPDIDTQQGSIMWDILAPMALEMNALYLKAADITSLGFVQTSVGEYLTELGFQFGITRLLATKTMRKAQFNVEVEIGTRFSVENTEINFVVFEKKGNDYILECETAGAIGNQIQGKLIPIDYVANLQSSNIGAIIITGEDEETDEVYRKRIIAHITRPQQDGNIDQYLKWASEFTGIGNATVIPLWNGANTVKIVITNSEGDIASPELVEKFQLYLDPKIEGKGEGKAPIGSFVTVESAKPQKVDINLRVVAHQGMDVTVMKENIKSALIEYMRTATSQRAFKKYEISTIIDQLKEVDYIQTFNGMDRVELGASSIFVLGNLVVEV